MSKIRYIFLLFILLAGVGIVAVLYINKTQTPLGLSFSPAFQLLGKPSSSINKGLSQLMPINQMDEKSYGEAIAESYFGLADTSDTDYIYLNMLVKDLTVFTKKQFNYQVFVIPTSVPNAFAMPGGVMGVTTGLLDILESEAQLASLLAHEIGHIERGHCFDAIKYELTFNKIKANTIGQLADHTFNLFLRHSFSKTQENEADEYGYDLVLLTKYDPMAFSGAFGQLQKQENSWSKKSSTIITDYFDTHPPLALRMQKFSDMGSEWWGEHGKRDKRYLGIRNLKERIPFSNQTFANEWAYRNNGL